MLRGSFWNAKKILTISYGIVYIFFTLWIIFHIPQYFPASQQEMWYKVFISYGILNSIIFANADLRNKLFNVKLTDFLPRFAIFFFGFLVVFYVLLGKIDPLSNSNFFVLLKSVPLWLAAVHGLVFATTESVIWQGWLDYKIGQPWSALTAGVFHFGIWSGGPLLVIAGATGLFLFFSFVNWYFRKSKSDLSPVIGCHTAFNYAKLGIMVSSGGALI